MALGLARHASAGGGWTRHIVYRRERTTTTWKFRFAVLAIVIFSLWLTGGLWSAAIAGSLVCDANGVPSDAILVENFDPDYLVFERASALHRAGLAARVVVPVRSDPVAYRPDPVARGTAEVMARIARLNPMEIIPIREVEPISLNAARDVLRFVKKEHIRSLIVVSPLFRSRRSVMVYTAALRSADVSVTCEPARSAVSVDTWGQSWHGIQDVALQWIKLQYYRLYVLPIRLGEQEPAGY